MHIPPRYRPFPPRTSNRGNPFTFFEPGDYTTNDFVTAMVTLAAPLPPNSDVTVHPTAFTLADGVQTLTNTTPFIASFFHFQTNASGEITDWHVDVSAPAHINFINTDPILDGVRSEGHGGAASFDPGEWTQASATPDAGSTLSLMTLTLMALGLLARRFQRAAG